MLATVCALGGHGQGAVRATEQARVLYERKGATALVTDAPVASSRAASHVESSMSGKVEISANRAARVVSEALVRLLEDDDPAAALRLVAEDVEVIDSRSLIAGSDLAGQEALLEHARVVKEIGTKSIVTTPIMTAGDDLALIRLGFLGGDVGVERFEVEMLAVEQTDHEGKVAFAQAFDVGDLDEAIRVAMARFIRTVDPATAEMLAVIHEYGDALNRSDFAAMRELVCEDVVQVDHERASSLDSRGAEAFLASVAEFHRLMPGVRAYPAEILRAAPNGVVLRLWVKATTADGADIDFERLTLTTVRDGKIARIERFDPADVDDAIASLDGGTTGSTERLANACSRSADRFVRAYVVDRDLHGVEQLAPDVVIDDRRRLVGGEPFVGREAAQAFAEQMAAIGTTDVDSECVAIRLEELALLRVVFHGADVGHERFGVEALVLFELDAGGLLARVVAYDPDELDVAMREMNQRARAGLEPDVAQMVDMLLSYADLLNRSELDAMRGLLADDLIQIDHQLAGLHEMRGVDAYIASVAEFHALIPGVQLRAVDVCFVGRNGGVGRLTVHGRSREGAEVDFALTVAITVREGRIARIERFDWNDVDRAVASLEAPEISPPENVASRAASKLVETVFSGVELEQIVANFSEEMTIEDRRVLFESSFQDQAAVRSFVEELRVVGVVGCDGVCLATRGDHLALMRASFYGPAVGGERFEGNCLVLVETKRSGEIVQGAAYEVDRLDDATAELDAKYYAGLTPAQQSALEVLVRYALASDRFDMGGMADTLAEDVVQIDHRPVGLPDLVGKDAILASVGEIHSLVAGHAIRGVSVAMVGDDRIVARLAVDGASSAGTPVDFERVTVTRVSDGKITRFEHYPPDVFDRVVESLRSEAETVLGPTNRAARVYAEVAKLALRDAGAIGELLAGDFVFEERRGLFAGTAGGDRAAAVDFAHGMSDVGTTDVQTTCVATRGESLALVSCEFSGPDVGSGGFSAGAYIVVGTNAEGALAFGISFDEEQRAEAFAELDARFSETLPAPERESWERGMDLLAALNSGDPDAYIEYLSPDLVHTDHRPVSIGRLEGRDQAINADLELGRLAPALRTEVVAVLRIGPRASVGEIIDHIGDDGGAPLEIAFLFVAGFRDGQIVTYDRYALDQRQLALARFDEIHRADDAKPLRLLDPLRLENAATRSEDLAWQWMTTGDWDAYRDLFSPDVVLDDRRAGLTSVTVGREALIEHNRLAASLAGEISIVNTPIAVRGERVALMRQEIASTGGWTTELLSIVALDKSGLQAKTVMFDPDDLDGAFAELDECYVAGEGSEFADDFRRGRDATKHCS